MELKIPNIARPVTTAAVTTTTSKYGILTYFKGNRILRNILVYPKDKDPMEQKSGIVYIYRYQELDCDDDYVEESAKTFGKRFEEHLKAPSTIHGH